MKATRIHARHEQDLYDIVNAVAAITEIPVQDIRGRSRRAEVVRARHMAMYIAKLNGVSNSSQTAYFDRDHTTVLHACAVMDDACTVLPSGRCLDPEVAETIKKIIDYHWGKQFNEPAGTIKAYPMMGWL
jgi:chromosomal replication initiation ATPase DnaA